MKISLSAFRVGSKFGVMVIQNNQKLISSKSRTEIIQKVDELGGSKNITDFQSKMVYDAVFNKKYELLED